MNDSELHAIIANVTGAWPSGVRAAVWAEALADKDHACAYRAYVRLRDNHVGATVSVGLFLQTYRDVRNEARIAAHRHEPACSSCDGSGWVSAATPPGRSGHFATACAFCEAGAQARRVQDRIDDARPRRPIDDAPPPPRPRLVQSELL